MVKEKQDLTKAMPLWARLRLAHNFADEDEIKEIERIANEIISKHPDIQKVLANESLGYTPQFGPNQWSPNRPLVPRCSHFAIPCIWDVTV
jgi:hypothetical protein